MLTLNSRSYFYESPKRILILHIYILKIYIYIYSTILMHLKTMYYKSIAYITFVVGLKTRGLFYTCETGMDSYIVTNDQFVHTYTF